MTALSKRLALLEQAPGVFPTRFFTGYPAEDRFYEAGASPINYRNGINGEPEDGQCFTKADLANLEKQGHRLSIIEIVYEDMTLEQR
jgi:hypothetical protein